MLHRRRMEAMADKGVLGRFQNSLASLGFDGPTSYRNRSYRHVLVHENERSFSWSAANMAAEWRAPTRVGAGSPAKEALSL
jgi:hypothetical protein